MRELFKAQARPSLAQCQPPVSLKRYVMSMRRASTAVVIPWCVPVESPRARIESSGACLRVEPQPYTCLFRTQDGYPSQCTMTGLSRISLLVTSNTHQGSVSELERQKVANSKNGLFPGPAWCRFNYRSFSLYRDFSA